jgi:hypothetical protein
MAALCAALLAVHRVSILAQVTKDHGCPISAGLLMTLSWYVYVVGD